jgi:hypothetical protein
MPSLTRPASLRISLGKRFFLGALLVFLGSFARGETPRKPILNFDRRIAPILAERCIACHSGSKPKGGLDLSRKAAALKGGSGGPAVVPRKPEDSLLFQRVSAGEMPPTKPIAAAEQALIKEWIAAGAPWGADPIDPFRFTTKNRAGADWWSLQPVRRPHLPQVKDSTWIRNPIDGFLLAKMEKRGLKPSSEADRRTLARRLSIDLLGLIPEPELVEEFVLSRAPDAYERLVDRLLASPHYGERWARHWLDIVRYGETDGFERNASRPNSWPYRDWLIGAFNSDLPYDEFCRLQVAGDVLRKKDGEGVKALGFLVAGIHNTVVPANKVAEATAFQDELEDLVGSVGQTFLGLTVNCGRCHDHKFDPVYQRDYYRLASALAGVRPGVRNLISTAASSDLVRLQAEAAALEKALAHIEEPVRRAILADRKKSKKGVVPLPTPIAAWDFRTGGKDLVGDLHVQTKGGATWTEAGLVFDGKTGFARSKPIARDLREKTLEVWVRLQNLKQSGGGAMTVQTLDGGTFDAVVFAEREPRRWMAGSNGFVRTTSFAAIEEKEADRQPILIAITYAADGTIRGFRNGTPYGKAYRSTGPVSYAAGKAVVAFGVRHEPAGGNRMLAGTIVQARLYDRVLSEGQVSASFAGAGFVTDAEVAARLSPALRRKRDGIRSKLLANAGKRSRLEMRKSMRLYTAVPTQPPTTRLLLRGQVTSPGQFISPGGVSILVPKLADFGLRPDAPEAERRRKLAEWLTARDNPLFHRVLVNRLWHYHFGTGIVDSPNDLGFNGGRPSHPELLDWLAGELMAQNYDLKSLHRLLVNSAAYRQSSAPQADNFSADADTRLLWRKRPLRLDGEVLRDSMLSIAGLLNREMGGPFFSDYKESGGAGTQYYDPYDPVGPAFHRRSVYRFLPRGGNQGLLDIFDCPDPASATPRRNNTTTPLQALTLWNGPFALRMAGTLAERVAAEVKGDIEGQVTLAYGLVFQRKPLPAEREAACKLVKRHGLKVFCRALFNTNEFLTLE